MVEKLFKTGIIMARHIHLLGGAENNNLNTLVGSFKKYTSRELIKIVKNPGESRKDWLLPIFKDAGEKIQETKLPGLAAG